MGLLILLQVALDLGFIAITALLLIERSKLKTAEDPRLSRGLQLLSSKIAILQDLMDRSETLGRQLGQIMDRKQQDIQERVEEAEVHLHKVKVAIEKSQEVAKIFQDRIPHQEIIERQNTLKYVRAAKLAHQGLSVDEISREVDIPRGELELIAKVNRHRLVVNEPLWMDQSPPFEDEVLGKTSTPKVELQTSEQLSDNQSEEPMQVLSGALTSRKIVIEEKVKPVVFRKIMSNFLPGE